VHWPMVGINIGLREGEDVIDLSYCIVQVFGLCYEVPSERYTEQGKGVFRPSSGVLW
jgi:hypothetical protein